MHARAAARFPKQKKISSHNHHLDLITEIETHPNTRTEVLDVCTPKHKNAHQPPKATANNRHQPANSQRTAAESGDLRSG